MRTSQSPDVREKGQDLLAVRDHYVEGYPDERWHPIVRGVDLSLKRGEVLGLIGESGAGKSTIGLAAVGYTKPGCRITKGTISFDGLDPAKAGEAERRRLRGSRMAYVAQSAAASFNPARERRTIELIRMVEMDEEHLDRLPGELSGGQKRRVCIARALTANPELIICDEVTSALDQVVQEEILKLLMRLQRDFGVSYIFITHDIATVRAIADDIAVMHKGRVVEQGLKTEVPTPPHPPYTELLLASVPEMDLDWLTRLLDRRRQANKRNDMASNDPAAAAPR